jgi:dienelactone hydrolase
MQRHLIRRAALAATVSAALAGSLVAVAAVPSQTASAASRASVSSGVSRASGVSNASGVSRASGAGLGGAAARSRAAGRVVIRDVRIPVPGQHAIPAYLVRPAGQLRPGSQAGILFLHWLGQIHSDRTEFLAEAVQLAGHGAVSLLPEGTFPYTASPQGTRRDVRAIRRQLAAFRAALNWLIARPSVRRARVAIVGHDYGAMYGALLASSDHRVHAAVLAAPDATWGHWFVKYWLGFTGQHAARYKALFGPLQPVRHVARLGRRELFQWAGQDIYIGAAVRQQFARHAPHARVEEYPDADHQLTTAAQADRDRFLTRVLGLS